MTRYDAVLVSGGDIRDDFALSFLRDEAERAGHACMNLHVRPTYIEQPGCEMCDEAGTVRQRPFLAAVDRGLDFFAANDIVPDLAVGDFDSVSGKGKAFGEKPSACTQIVTLPREKDESDTEAALSLVIGKGKKNILILGALGGRADHALANLGLLLYGKRKGVRVTIRDPENEIFLVPESCRLSGDYAAGRYVSFFALGGPVHHLTLTGFYYPLTDYELSFDGFSRTISNQVKDKEAFISYSGGSLLMILSSDRRDKLSKG